jgi:hypothetical protein
MLDKINGTDAHAVEKFLSTLSVEKYRNQLENCFENVRNTINPLRLRQSLMSLCRLVK